jgi:phosphomannomutase
MRNEGAVFDAIDGARVRHADGWWLLRPSNTQAMLSARAGTSAAGLERVLADLDCHLTAAGVSR